MHSSVPASPGCSVRQPPELTPPLRDAGVCRYASYVTTQERLMHQALRLISAHGFEQVTLDQIAAGTSNTKGAVYHHFSSKSDLYQKALLYLASSLADASIPDDALNVGVSELLLAAITPVRTAGFDLSNADVYYLIFDGMRRFPDLAETLRGPLRRYVERVARRLPGSTSTSGDGMDPHALLILALVEGLGLVQEITGGLLTEPMVRAIADQIVQGDRPSD